MIDFNVPPYVGTEMEYVRQSAEDNHKICGDGPFTKRCQSWLEERFCADKVLLTTSGTTALEMAAMLCDLEPGDEVILPSFTFSSTATAFVLMGAKLVFVDILPDTKNIDPAAIRRPSPKRLELSCPSIMRVLPATWTKSWLSQRLTVSSWLKMPPRVL